ncbi:hypothetical protein AVEN_105468-1 [Araneus ventricosus]|uniref:Uncharacterized protein n=1 Tax=Araneus ventricosus TaxID=182803 RepID=A0A4Y2VX39_ARAVE|nr:hypothetical protein AVEN_105468-1 [Araneus ventricosus]
MPPAQHSQLSAPQNPPRTEPGSSILGIAPTCPRQYTTLSNSDLERDSTLVVLDGELEMSRNDPSFLVVSVTANSTLQQRILTRQLSKLGAPAPHRSQHVFRRRRWIRPTGN